MLRSLHSLGVFGKRVSDFGAFMSGYIKDWRLGGVVYMDGRWKPEILLILNQLTSIRALFEPFTLIFVWRWGRGLHCIVSSGVSYLYFHLQTIQSADTYTKQGMVWKFFYV
jgi:hypothetical protein